jgi:hypothetical protein
MTDITRQLGLFDSPRPVVPADPNVPPEAVPRLSKQCREVLARLRRGPATGASLCMITHRFGGRIFDLRKAGCTIKTEHDPVLGTSVYTLIHEPEGLT